ncbi:MAG TPA: ankyrin repeat domain-containing protein [Nocardioides sp.]|uniref:ankyrin repeat domain-containing protein n=1 Tax=Nocardioides sp. TaxID=35761 RepID=UPI002D7E3EBF|nr:ankyrin repeat domain-containing protein [Nocardioides sp.]HET6653968.1 ankyrin repeat domain-containing protein [Nocardioides sp.]
MDAPGRLTVALGLLLVGACSGPAQTPDAAASSPAGPAAPSASTATPGQAESPAPDRSGTPTPDPGPAEQARLDQRLRDAAWADDVELARRLIRRGADVNAKDDTVQSAYLISTSEGHLRLLDLTLRNGARVNDKDSFNGTGLIRAADRGHAQVVGRLVRAGIALDHVNNLGWTALHEAIILGDGGPRYVETVRVLVAAGADVGVPSARDGVTPVQHARSRGYDQMAALLERAAGREVPRARASDVLLEAAASGDADRSALALRAGADLEARDERRRTPLLRAATGDRVAVARLLVAMGADPDALDDQHDTPWLVTGVTGSVPMLEALLPAGPDLTIRNRFGGVSVIPASERGHVDYVRRVVRTGIDVDHVNDLGWTAMLEAVILGDGGPAHREIVRILLRAGADQTIADRNGVTPLEHAEASGQTGVARILREAR